MYVINICEEQLSINDLLFSFIYCCVQSYDPEDGYNDGPGPLVGSFPKDFGYGPDEHDDELPGGATAENKPRILLMGLRRYKIQRTRTGT